MSRDARGYILFGLGYTLVLEAMLVPAILWWPSFAEHAETLKDFFGKIPVLGETIDLAEKTGVKGYVFGQHFFKGCNVLGTAAAILFAMGAVAGEAYRGTMEIWLARPVSRLRLLCERFGMGLCALWIPVALTSATIPWLLSFVDTTMTWRDLSICTMHQCLFLSMVYGVTFLLSALGSQPTAIAFGMLLFTTFQFSIYLVKEATHYSLFRLVDLEAFLKITGKAGIDWVRELEFVGIAGGCLALAYVVFRRRVP